MELPYFKDFIVFTHVNIDESKYGYFDMTSTHKISIKCLELVCFMPDTYYIVNHLIIKLVLFDYDARDSPTNVII